MAIIARGYLHGSANQAVLRMLAEIGDKKADQQKRSEVEGLALYLFDAEAEAPGRH